MKLMTTPRLLVVLCVAALTLPAFAQDATNPMAERAATAAAKARGALDTTPTLLEKWDDFLHYINTANVLKAQSDGEAILDSGATPKAIYKLTVERPKSLTTLHKARKLADLKPLAEKYLALVEKGYIEWRSDPTEIRNSILMTAKSLRGFQVGKARLKESGEYALPQMMQYLLDEATAPLLRQRIIMSLPEMGHQAVRAYSIALLAKDTQIVETMANALYELQYPAALPRLREALLRKDLPVSTIKAIKAAIIACSPANKDLSGAPVAALFYQQAVKYYNRDDSLRPDPRFDDAFVWNWKEGTGLIQIAVPRNILCDIYSMRMARLALSYDAKFSPAVPVWLSAVSRREIYLPAGKTDPLWPASKPKAAFYRLASSPQYLMLALTRAMNDTDVPLVKAIITSLGKNTGPSALTKPLPGGTQPLVDAMTYPERTVRYLAAETLATAMPSKQFPGSISVMPILSDAIRQRGKKYCLLVANDPATRNKLKAAIREADYEVIEQDNISKLIVTATNAPGVDIVVTGPAAPYELVTNLLRRNLAFKYLPIVACKATPKARDFGRKDGKMVLHAPADFSEAGIATSLEAATKLAAGKPLPEDKALDWAIRACNAITKTGQRTSIYNLKQTVASLVGATLMDDEADLQIAAADALAVIDSAAAQQAIVSLALAGGDDEVRITACNAASRSIQRFGNKATAKQATALVTMVASPKSGELYEAAAQLLGTMNLSSDQAKDLILKS